MMAIIYNGLFFVMMVILLRALMREFYSLNISYENSFGTY